MAAAGFTLLLIGLIHLLLLVGGIFGFVGRVDSALARRALRLNFLVLIAFWAWALFFSPC